MRLLLIGGSGFIGRYVVAELARGGHEVGVLGRSRAVPGAAHFIAGDRKRLGDCRGRIAEFAPDVVVDLIASSGTQARGLVEVVRGIARRTVVLSSVDVYRACGVLHRIEPGPLEPLPLTESSALRSVLQTYPAQQLAALQHLFGWVDSEYDKITVERSVRDLDATVLRLPMIYGPGDRLHRFHALLQRMHDRRPAIVMQDGVARWRAPRGYVENVAAAIALAATDSRATGRVYNVTEAETFTELEWAQRIARALGWDGSFVIAPADELPPTLRMPGNLAQHWVVSSERLRRELDYREPVTDDDALGRTIEWERANPPATPIGPPIDYAAEDVVIAAHRPSA